MNKEEILEKSRKENMKGLDEYELSVHATAAKVGMAVGGFTCMLLVILGELVLNNHLLGIVGWFVYFAMQGGSNLTLFIKLKKRIRLVYAIAEITFAVVFAVLIALKGAA